MRTVTIKSIAEPKGLIGGPFGSSLVGKDYVESGVPVIRGTNLNHGRYVGGGFAYVSDDKFAAELSRNSAQGGDLIYTQRGTLGQVALLDPVESTYVISQSQMRLRVDKSQADPLYVYYASTSQQFLWQIDTRAISTGVPHINLGLLAEFEIPLPPLPEQRAIAATLGALDDKIESNRRQRMLLRSLGNARFVAASEHGSRRAALEEVASSIARGVAPKYADDDVSAPHVINQKCIRDGWVSLEPARRMIDREVAPAKRAARGDILVNSTGTGTLGRVARWHGSPIFVDGHVTVVKPDPDYVPPTVAAYALLGRETDIVDLATGSTGQTELSAKRLAELEVTLPNKVESGQLEPVLLALENRSEQLASESAHLVSLRESLLPELLSGRLQTQAAS